MEISIGHFNEGLLLTQSKRKNKGIYFGNMNLRLTANIAILCSVEQKRQNFIKYTKVLQSTKTQEGA